MHVINIRLLYTGEKRIDKGKSKSSLTFRMVSHTLCSLFWSKSSIINIYNVIFYIHTIYAYAFLIDFESPDRIELTVVTWLIWPNNNIW